MEAVPVFPSHPKNFEPIDAGVARGVRPPRGILPLTRFLFFSSCSWRSNAFCRILGSAGWPVVPTVIENGGQS